MLSEYWQLGFKLLCWKTGDTRGVCVCAFACPDRCMMNVFCQGTLGLEWRLLIALSPSICKGKKRTQRFHGLGASERWQLVSENPLLWTRPWGKSRASPAHGCWWKWLEISRLRSTLILLLELIFVNSFSSESSTLFHFFYLNLRFDSTGFLATLFSPGWQINTEKMKGV